MGSRLILAATLVLLLLGLPSLALASPSVRAQAQGTWTASFGVSGFNSATDANYSVVGHFSFSLSNLTGTGGVYFLSTTLSGTCSGRFAFNQSVVYAATYDSGTNQLSFTQLSGGMPSSGYFTYSCSVGTGGTYANYITTTPFKTSPFTVSLASGSTVPISGTGYFGSVSGTLVVLSGTSVVTSFSSSSTSTSSTSSPTVSFTLTSTASSSTSSSSSGGIPEFPYQTFFVVIFAAVIVASYLAVRHRRDSA